MPCRLKPEGVDVRRQVQIIVDRLRYVNHSQRLTCNFGSSKRGKGGIIAADRNQMGDPGCFQRSDHA